MIESLKEIYKRLHSIKLSVLGFNIKKNIITDMKFVPSIDLKSVVRLWCLLYVFFSHYLNMLISLLEVVSNAKLSNYFRSNCNRMWMVENPEHFIKQTKLKNSSCEVRAETSE